jgi:hypothetical protein
MKEMDFRIDIRNPARMYYDLLVEFLHSSIDIPE